MNTSSDLKRKGHLFVISAPSGAGKTSLIGRLTQTLSDIKVSISYTTRPVRPEEVHGVNYFFVDRPKFLEMIDQAELLEYAEVFGYYYGTSADWVHKTLAAGIDVVLEIDWQGAQQILDKFSDAISIFILPPSMQVLRERLNKRSQDAADVIEKRLAGAKVEMRHCVEFKYLLVNDVFEQSLDNLLSIVKAARLERAYQINGCRHLL